MAHGAVGARIQGDVYQGLFFWRLAAGLLIPRTLVQRVDLEHDAASGVDDVAVFYEPPGTNAGGCHCTADYYQVKYHVDQRDAYCSETLVDPDFIRSKKSILLKFYEAYQKIRTTHPHCRLHLASNWTWRNDDPLAKLIREDGQLPDAFFTDLAHATLGKIRESWQAHLSIDLPIFTEFAKTLRFDLNHFGRTNYQENVYDRLQIAGLEVPPASHASSRFDSLVQQFQMTSPHEFTRERLRQLCQDEGLFAPKPFNPPPTIALRSFVRFAENIENEADHFVCVANEFDGRHPKTDESWKIAARQVIDFMANPQLRKTLRQQEHAIMLECHGSLALLAGYEISNNTGCSIYPIQKPGRLLWKPQGESTSAYNVTVTPHNSKAVDIAVIVSVTHDIAQTVANFLGSDTAPSVHTMVNIAPSGGCGPNSISDAAAAQRLASDIVSLIRTHRSTASGSVHLFFSAPNSLLFFIGQFREALGKLSLYEFDFSSQRTGSYALSITLPIATI